MGALKDKVLDELYKNNYRDLYNQIDQIDNDVDVANYINSSKKYFTQTMTNKDLEGMPTFSQALFGELKTGNVDYNKEFGEDWYNKFEEIPYQEIKYVADKQGVNPNELINKMGEESTKLRRYDIAHGNNPDATIMDKVGSVAMSLFGRRQQEAIERGEDPKLRDYAGDVGEQVLSFAPLGTIARGLNASSKIGKLLTMASNGAVPLATESFDTIAYDDSNPRGKFSGADVISGGVNNAVAPLAIKGVVGGMAGAVGNHTVEDAIKNFAKLDVPIKEDRISRLLGGLRNSPQARAQGYSTKINTNPENAAKSLTANKLSKGLAFDKEYKAIYDRLYAKLAARQGRFNGTNPNMKHGAGSVKISYNEAMKDFTPDELQFIVNDPDLVKYLPGELNSMPKLRDLGLEEGFEHYMTNQHGNIWAKDADPWTRLGYFGEVISDSIEEQEKEEQDKLLQEAILEELKEKYGTPNEPKTFRVLKGVK